MPPLSVVDVVDEVLEVDWLEVDVCDGVVKEDDVVAVAREHLVHPRRVGRRQQLLKEICQHITHVCFMC